MIARALASFLFLSSLAACVAAPEPPATEQAAEIKATTQVLSEHALTSPSGKTYRYFTTNDAGAQSETRAERHAGDEQFFAATAFVPLGIAERDWFAGKARAHAKTSMAHAKVTAYRNLQDLLSTLPSDKAMLDYDPPIARDTGRVREEIRNVGVCAFMAAAKREADNDYHIILSNGRKAFMNVEVSGVPRNGSARDQKLLWDVRKVFESFVDETGRSVSAYTGWGDLVPVYVEGSLFYDTEHAPGKVGPAWARPKTSWEVHPITRLEFESPRCS